MTTENRINLFLFIFLACLWSGSFIGIKAVVESWPPLFSAMVRVAIALVAVAVIFAVMQKKVAVPFSLRWKIWMIGLFAQAFPFALLFWGERLISPGLAGILNGTVPLWTYIFSLFLLPGQTSFSSSKTIGLLIGMVGIAIIFWPLISFDQHAGTITGAYAILIMAISYAIANVLNQYFLQGKSRIDFFANIYHQHWSSLILLLVLSLSFESWPGVSALKMAYIPWVVSAYLGVFSTATAFLIYYHLIREWDGLRASTVLYLIPAITLVLDYFIYATAARWSEIIGITVILASIAMIQWENIKMELRKK